MFVFLIACVVSFVPFVGLFLWLRNQDRNDEAFRGICNKAFKKGIFSVLLIILVSAIFYLGLRLTGVQNRNPLLYQALYTFIVLAFAEELVKYLTFRSLLMETDYPFSWLDVTTLMTTVGLGFGLIEAVIYAVGASVPVVLVRGLCVPHAGFGFIVGYFYGKGLKNADPSQKWIGFLLAFLIHGLYDFSLTQEFIAINENLMFVALGLSVLDIVLVIRLILFVRKARKQDVYLEPLCPPTMRNAE